MMSRFGRYPRRVAIVGVGFALLSVGNTSGRAQQSGPSGAEVWAANCGRCHRARAGDAYTASQWNAIVTQMSMYARLTPDETQAVRQFLVSGARREGAANAATGGAPAATQARQIAYLNRSMLAAPTRDGRALAAPSPMCRKSAAGPKAANIYKVQCAMCHGPTGKGDGPMAAMQKPRPLSLADAARMAKASDDSLVKVVSLGRNSMPAFKELLTAEQIRDVVTFVRCFSTP